MRRDRLIQQHVYIVRDVLARLGGCLQETADFGDLGGHGLAALIEAAEDYAGQEEHFAPFARLRVTRRMRACIVASEWYQRVAWPVAMGLEAAEGPTWQAAMCAVMAVQMQALLGAQGDCASRGRAPLHRTLEALPGRERTVLALYYMEELSLPEIAQALEWELEAVRATFASGGAQLVAGMKRGQGQGGPR